MRSLANPVAKGLSAKTPDQRITAFACGAGRALCVADLGADGTAEIDQDDAPSVAGAVALGAAALLARATERVGADGNAIRGIVIGNDAVCSVWAIAAERGASLGGKARFGVAIAIIAFVAGIGGDKLISGVAALAAISLRRGRTDGRVAEDAIGSDLTGEISMAAFAEPSRGEATGLVADLTACAICGVDTSNQKQAFLSGDISRSIGGFDRENKAACSVLFAEVFECDLFGEIGGGVGFFVEFPRFFGLFAFEGDDDLCELVVVGDARGEFDLVFKDLPFARGADEDLGGNRIDADADLGGRIGEIAGFIKGTGGEDDALFSVVRGREGDVDWKVGGFSTDPRCVGFGAVGIFDACGCGEVRASAPIDE